MERLNDKCLLNIFQYVSVKDWVSISKVCKHWKLLVSYLWKGSFSITYNIESIDVDIISLEDLFEIMRYFGPLFRNIRLLNGCSKTLITFDTYQYTLKSSDTVTTNDLIDVLNEVAFNIQFVNIRQMKDVHKDKLAKLLILNKEIKHFKCSHLEEDILEYLSNNLELAKFKYSKTLNEQFFKFLARQNQLKEFHIYSDCIDDPNELMLVISKNSTNLETFCCCSFFTTEEFTMTSLRILSNFVNLKKLHLAGDFIKLTDGEVFKMVSHCRKIEYIKFDNLSVSNNAITVIMTLPNLEILKLNCVSNFTEMNLERTSNSLHELFLCNSDTPRFNYTSILPSLLKLPDLTILNFYHDEYVPIKTVCSIIKLIAALDQQVILQPTDLCRIDLTQIIFKKLCYENTDRNVPEEKFYLLVSGDIMSAIVQGIESQTIIMRLNHTIESRVQEFVRDDEIVFHNDYYNGGEYEGFEDYDESCENEAHDEVIDEVIDEELPHEDDINNYHNGYI